jgi:GDP-L-fucose synthase
MQKTDRIFVAGHRGLAGGALLRELQRAGYSHVLTRSSQELNLRDRAHLLETAFQDRRRV